MFSRRLRYRVLAVGLWAPVGPVYPPTHAQLVRIPVLSIVALATMESVVFVIDSRCGPRDPPPAGAPSERAAREARPAPAGRGDRGDRSEPTPPRGGRDDAFVVRL